MLDDSVIGKVQDSRKYTMTVRKPWHVDFQQACIAPGPSCDDRSVKVMVQRRKNEADTWHGMT